jgi:gliding motility-associated-like protein
MRKILPFIFLFICIGKWAFSQSCIPTNLNGSTIVISCNAPCSDIGFQVPHLKTTEDYIVNSIPYNAFAYTGGTVVSSIYIDDKFSPLITMGFPFCFYGQTYNDIVIGSNAVVTFEAICANAANAYTLDVGGVPQPIPYNSPASPAGIGTTYYPRASIMGVYQDIDPANSPLPTRRIEYRVEGTAPCRKFVISYKDIRMFSCNNLIATNQIVLYENTGVVEVYIQDKPVCPTWISGLGIIGVQDFTRTKAVAAPGKNCTAFSESNTGYRFTPSGTNSRYLSSELLDMGGAVIALADTATTVPGILDINFPNICPGPSVTQYIVRTRFSSCPVGPIMENLDTINVVRNNVLPVAVDSVPTTCNTNSGSITITPSAGVAPYTATATGPGGPYNYNGASPIVFSNLPAGMYSIYVTDNFGCDTSFNIEVTAITSLSQTVTSTNTSCAGANDGTITVTPTSGVAPFSATATGPGGPYTVAGPSPLVFTGLPAGTFNITFTDALGCTGNLIRTINQGVGLTAVPSRTNTTCFGGSNGSLTITPTVPGAYTFVLNPGGFTNTTGVFTGLVAGSYQCTFTNASGCSGTIVSLVVLSGPQLTGTHTFTNASCSGAPNGTITVTPTTPGSYTYFLNPGAITNTTGIFTGLIPGTYSVLATNSVGCTFVRSNIVINAGSSLSGTATSGTTTCPGATDGTITVTPATPGTYNYVLTPGGATSTTGTFTGLAPGTYSVLATNTVSGCTFNVSNINVINGTAPTGSATSGTTTCPGATDGTITVTTATPGTYTYVLNPGGATNTTGVFTGLATGTYTATGTNTVSGCIFTVNNINVTNGPALTGSATTNTTTCPGATDGTINVTPAIPGTYTYVLSPGAATNTTGIFTALTTGTYSVTANNAIGCSFTVNNINVTDGTGPTGNATTNTTTCPGATDGTITVTTASPGAYTYVLTPGGATNTTGIFTALTTGTYSVTANNAIGCSFTVNNINVTNGAVPVSTASSTATTCPTINNGSISVTEPGVAGTTLFTLNPGGISNTTGLFNGLAPGSYTITFATAIGCTGTVTPNLINVVAGPTLSSAVAQTNPVCNNINDGVITITQQPGTTAPYFATLTGPGGPFTYNGPAPIVFNNLAPGIYSYSYSEAGGCAGTGGPVTLSSNPAINSLSTLVMPGCNGFTNGTITFNPTGGVAPYSYTSVNAGTAAGNVFSGLSANIVYLFTVTDAVGCTKDTSITLTEPNVLVASANSPVPSTCFGNDGKITVSATGGTTAYQYSINGTAFQSSPNFTAPNIGAYNVVVVKDAKGCKDTTNVTVVMIDTMRLSAGVDTVVCVRSAVTLQPQVNAIAPSAITWQWSSTNAPASTIANPSVQNAVVSPADTATYVVHAIWGLCERWDTLIVNVLHEPIANAGNDTAVCHRFTALLNGSHSNSSGPVIYTWTPNLYITDIHAPVTSVLLPDAGNYIYTLNVQDDYGCNFITNDAMQLIVTPPVPAFAGHDTIAVLGEQHQLYGSGGVQFTWLPAAPLNNAAAQNPLATLYNDTRFTLEVMDIAGCKGWDTVFIKVYAGPTYYVPTAFSPNGDGRNDIFRPIPSGIVKTNWFRVYNRFGNLLFETNEWLKGWDGRYRGRKQPIGAYVWMIQGVDNNGKIIEKKGTVILVE